MVFLVLWSLTAQRTLNAKTGLPGRKRVCFFLLALPRGMWFDSRNLDNM